MRIGVSDQRVQKPLTLGEIFTRLKNQLRIAAKDKAQAREATYVTPAEQVKERQDQLIKFYGVYEDLVEALCDAAQYGPTPALERAYARSRTWMHTNYAPVRKYVVAYLQYATEDATTSLDHQSPGADAFEALVAAPSIAEFLEHDDGLMISRLARTREALNLYAEHLRQLSRAAA